MFETMKFTYTKKNGEVREVELLPLTWDELGIEGLDLTKLPEGEVEELRAMLDDLQEFIDIHMKTAYRRFLNKGIKDAN